MTSEGIGSNILLAVVRSHPGNLCLTTKERKVGGRGGSDKKDST